MDYYGNKKKIGINNNKNSKNKEHHKGTSCQACNDDFDHHVQTDRRLISLWN